MWEILWRSFGIGVGATAIYDLWGRMLVGAFGLPAPNWTLVGRWFSHMPRGRFTHDTIATAAPMPFETPVGWAMHYLIGVFYALTLLAFWGMDWVRQPSLAPALIVGVVTIIGGWFIMIPAMGFGMAGSRNPNVWMLRTLQLAGHVVFGLGLYLSAWALVAVTRLLAQGGLPLA